MGRHRLLGRLNAEHVDTTQVVVRRGGETGAAVVHVDEAAQKQILAVLGADQSLTSADVDRAIRTLGRARVVLAQLEVPLNAARAAMTAGRAIDAVTVLDPAPPQPLSDDLWRLIDVITPSSSEAEVLTTMRVTAVSETILR